MAKDPDKGETSDESDALVNAEIEIHLPRELNEASCERRPDEVIGGEQRRDVLGIRQWDVGYNALEDTEACSGEDGDPGRGRYPVDICTGCPCEEEEAYWGTECADQAGEKPLFLRDGDAFVFVELPCSGMKT